MKAKISEWMDGELDEGGARELIAALAREGEALEAWSTYHLISDAMRDARLLSAGFAARLAARLAQEPAVFAPGRLAAVPDRGRWFGWSAAASVAAVALVGWLAFAPQPDVKPLPNPVATAPQKPAPIKEPIRVPLPSAANDYLLAHQSHSPRISLQGMAPYVRTVSDQAGGGRKP